MDAAIGLDVLGSGLESNFRVEAGQPPPSHRRRRPGAMDILEPCPAVSAAPTTVTP